VASRGPKQTPEEAAAPPQPEVVPTESVASTASLVEVDMPSVRTIASDLLEQDARTTDTDADQLERERAEADLETKKKDRTAAGKRSGKKAAEDDGGGGNLASMLQRLAAPLLPASADAADLSPTIAAAVLANAAAVVGLSAALGFSAWRLYERGRLGWKVVGLGLAALGAVAAGEVALGRYLFGPKDKK